MSEQYGLAGNLRELFFYPTRIAVSMIFGSDSTLISGGVSGLQDMRIIVETNNQVVKIYLQYFVSIN